MHDFHGTFRDLLHAVNVRHGTDGFTSPPKEGALRIFSPWKIRRLRPGLNPRTWVPKASTLLLDHRSRSNVHPLQTSYTFRSTWDKRNTFCIIGMRHYNRPPSRCPPPHAKLRNKLQNLFFVSEINRVVTSRDNFLHFFNYTVFVIT